MMDFMVFILSHRDDIVHLFQDDQDYIFFRGVKTYCRLHVKYEF